MYPNKKAFLTIEILISMLIVFISIITLTSAIKSNVLLSQKGERHEITFITVQSIKNYLQDIDIPDTIGNDDYTLLDVELKEINNFNIYIYMKSIKKINNYLETLEGGSNTGLDISYIYHVQLKLQKDNYSKEFEFYLNKFIKSDYNEILSK